MALAVYSFIACAMSYRGLLRETVTQGIRMTKGRDMMPRVMKRVTAWTRHYAAHAKRVKATLSGGSARNCSYKCVLL